MDISTNKEKQMKRIMFKAIYNLSSFCKGMAMAWDLGNPCKDMPDGNKYEFINWLLREGNHSK